MCSWPRELCQRALLRAGRALVQNHTSLWVPARLGWLSSHFAGGLCLQVCVCLRSSGRPDLHLMQISRRNPFIPMKELD